VVTLERGCECDTGPHYLLVFERTHPPAPERRRRRVATPAEKLNDGMGEGWEGLRDVKKKGWREALAQVSGNVGMALMPVQLITVHL
jgi:hypothetical protein